MKIYHEITKSRNHEKENLLSTLMNNQKRAKEINLKLFVATFVGNTYFVLLYFRVFVIKT